MKIIQVKLHGTMCTLMLRSSRNDSKVVLLKVFFKFLANCFVLGENCFYFHPYSYYYFDLSYQ